MSTTLVKSVPLGDFVEISVLTPGWEARLHALVKQNRPIKFDMYPHPDIFQTFQARIQQQGYSTLVPENDRWQHFLMPNSKPSAA